jgi:copine 5/8/9
MCAVRVCAVCGRICLSVSDLVCWSVFCSNVLGRVFKCLILALTHSALHHNHHHCHHHHHLPHRFAWCGKGLDKKDFLGKSDPFLIISKKDQHGNLTAVHRTEVIKYTLNPTWLPFAVPLQKLCNGNYDLPLNFECRDWDRDGSHDFIGSFDTTLNEMLRGKKQHQLINQRKTKKRKYVNSGVLHCLNCQVERVPSFLDFIRGGCEINMMVAVDFTASNGKVNNPKSLHYIKGSTPNDYEKAIRAVGDVIGYYDSDKKYPTFGFGGKLPGKSDASHCFPLNLNDADPECAGIEGILSAYKEALKKVTLWGPTNFGPLLHRAIGDAGQCTQMAQHYTILCILTDGEITDMPASRW